MSPPSTSLPTSAADFPADLRSAIYQEFLARAAQNIGVLPTTKTLRELSRRMPQHRVLLVPLWRAHGHREDEVVAILRHANEDQDINIEALLRQSQEPVSSFTAARDRKREALVDRLVGPAADPCKLRREGSGGTGTAPITHVLQPAYTDTGVVGCISSGAGTGLASRVDARAGQGRGEAADPLALDGELARDSKGHHTRAGVGMGVEAAPEGWGVEGVEPGRDGALDSAGLGSTLEAASAWAREGLRARTEAAAANAVQRQREEAGLASSRSGWGPNSRTSVDGTPCSPLPRASSLVPVQMSVPARSLTDSRMAQRAQRGTDSASAPEDATMRARVRHNLRLSGLDWPPQPEPVREDPLSQPLLPASVLAGTSLYQGWYRAVAREGVTAVAGDGVGESVSVPGDHTRSTPPSSAPSSPTGSASAPAEDSSTAAAVAPHAATPPAEERTAIPLRVLAAEALPSSVLVAAETAVDVGPRADVVPPVLASASLPFARHSPLALVVHATLRADSALPFPQPSPDFPALHARSHPSLVPSSAAPTDDVLLPATLSQQHWPRVHQALSLGHIGLTAALPPLGDVPAPSQEVPRTEHARARARLDAACLTWIRTATEHAEAALEQFAATPTASATAVRESVLGQLPGLAPPPPALNRFGEQAQLLPMPIYSYQRLVRAHPHIERAFWPEYVPQRQPGLPSFATSVDPVLPASLCSLERTRTRTRHGAPGPRAGTLLVQPCVSLRRYLAELAVPPHVSLHTAQWLLACAASGVKAALEAYNKGCGAAACVDVERTCGLLWSVLSHRDVATVTVLLTHYVFKRITPHGHHAHERPGSSPDTASIAPVAATNAATGPPATPPAPLPYTAVSEKSLATSILLLASTITDALRQPWVPVPTLVLLPLIADCIEAATTSALAVHYSELFRAIPWPAHVVITSAVDALLVRVLNRSLNTYDMRSDAAGAAGVAVARIQRVLLPVPDGDLSKASAHSLLAPVSDLSAHKRAQTKALASAPVFVPPSTAVSQLGGVQSLALSAPQLHMLGLLVTAGCDRLHAFLARLHPDTPLPSPLAPALLASALPDLFPALLPACLARMHTLLWVLAPLVAGRVGDDSVIAAATHQALCTDLTRHTHAPDNPLALPLLLLSTCDCSADRVPVYARSHTWATVCAAALEAAVAMVVVERIGTAEEARVRARGLVAESHVWREWSRVCTDAYTAVCGWGDQPPAATLPNADAAAVVEPAEGEEEWDWLRLSAGEFGLLEVYGAPAQPSEAMAALLRAEAEGTLRREGEDGGANGSLLAAANSKAPRRQPRSSSYTSPTLPTAVSNMRTSQRKQELSISATSSCAPRSGCDRTHKRADAKVAGIVARHAAPAHGGPTTARAAAMSAALRAQETTKTASSASSQSGLLGARADYYKLMQRYSRNATVGDAHTRTFGRDGEPDASALAQVGAHLASQHAQRYNQMHAPSLLLAHMRDVEE